MPASTMIPSGLLETDGVFQNLTMAVGITVKPLQDGKTRLAITDGVAQSTIILNEVERLHLIDLLGGAFASEETPSISA